MRKLNSFKAKTRALARSGFKRWPPDAGSGDAHCPEAEAMDLDVTINLK